MVNPRQTRRRFLRAGGLAAVTAVVPTLGCDRSKVTFLETPTAPVEMPPVEVPEGGLPAELPAAPIVSNDRFYLQSIKGPNYDPEIRAGQWSLAVDGLVERPEQGLRYEAITAMPLQRQVMTMQCIGNWIGGPLVGNAEWGGTPFRNLLDQVGVRSEAIRVKFTSVDGYTTSIPLDRALREEVLLAWEMNGETLPSKHGYPVRLINPGHYGQKMPKWITRIELIDEEFLGYWESRPENKPFKWSDAAVATVNSRIDAPVSLWDDEKDPANGGVTYVYQTLQRGGGRGIRRPRHRHGRRAHRRAGGGQHRRRRHLGGGRPHLPQRAERVDHLVPPLEPARQRPLRDPGPGHRFGRRGPAAQGRGRDLYDGRTGWHNVPVDVSTT